MDTTTTHTRYAKLVQQHAQQGLSPADAAAAATATLGAEAAASSAASSEIHEATWDGDGGEEMRDLAPDAKRHETEGAGGEHTDGEHTGDGGTTTAAGSGLSSTAVGLPSDTGGAGGESKESGAHQGPGEGGVINPDGSLNSEGSSHTQMSSVLSSVGSAAPADEAASSTPPPTASQRGDKDAKRSRSARPDSSEESSFYLLKYTKVGTFQVVIEFMGLEGGNAAPSCRDMQEAWRGALPAVATAAARELCYWGPSRGIATPRNRFDAEGLQCYGGCHSFHRCFDYLSTEGIPEDDDDRLWPAHLLITETDSGDEDGDDNDNGGDNNGAAAGSEAGSQSSSASGSGSSRSGETTEDEDGDEDGEKELSFPVALLESFKTRDTKSERANESIKTHESWLILGKFLAAMLASDVDKVPAIRTALHSMLCLAERDLPSSTVHIGSVEHVGDAGLFCPSLGMTLASPLDPEQLRGLAETLGRAAPFGKGEETVVDDNVRKTTELTLGDANGGILVTNPAFHEIIDGDSSQSIIEKIKDLTPRLSGPDTRVVAVPYKMLIYDGATKDHFVEHKDTVRFPSHFASLIVNLPVKGGCAGGDLVLCYGGDGDSLGEDHLGHSATEHGLGWDAFYTDVPHRVNPVTKGMRVTLTYFLLAVPEAGTVIHRPIALGSGIQGTSRDAEEDQESKSGGMAKTADNQVDDTTCTSTTDGEIVPGIPVNLRDPCFLLGVLVRLVQELPYTYGEELPNGGGFPRNRGMKFSLVHEYTKATLEIENLKGADSRKMLIFQAANRVVNDCNDEMGKKASTKWDPSACLPSLELLTTAGAQPSRSEVEPPDLVDLNDNTLCGKRYQPLVVGVDHFLRRMEETGGAATRTYTGNEGMETSYLYSAAVISIGLEKDDDY
jgi:hypothetical protein